MDRVAAFVDAGYLFAQGSAALSGHKLPRSGVSLDYEKAIAALKIFASQVSGLPLLRIYWYDGTSTGPTSQHIALAYLEGVKVRLGFVNSVGEQKGVDSLIVTDMINLARNRAMADAVLLSGDEDLRVGVQQAQEFGVRVHLLGIKPSRGSQSIFLLQEADSTHEWGPGDLQPFFSCRPAPAELFAASASSTVERLSGPSQFRNVAEQLARQIPVTELASLVLSIRQTSRTPDEIDGKLLIQGQAVLQARLRPEQKREIRSEFLKACETLLEPDPQTPL